VLKSDIDMVSDIHLRQAETLIHELTGKLYRRNPRDLRKVSGVSIQSPLTQLFAPDRVLNFAEIEHKQGVPAILLALEPDYSGDRVFPLLVGILSMIRSSYNNQSEFFLLDRLEPQKLYNSARNIEVLVWRLKSRLAIDGTPLILTDSLPGEEQNLSFERLFSKLIASQDIMAKISAKKLDRMINQIVHSTAASVFLPVGL